ncbi:hypothetical protein BJ912DRAFT_25804 [Pholiota molesta]|nr:hypothetical protein BJ912DRAFT_25804 [Pholiota molesta]
MMISAYSLLFANPAQGVYVTSKALFSYRLCIVRMHMGVRVPCGKSCPRPPVELHTRCFSLLGCDAFFSSRGRNARGYHVRVATNWLYHP